MRVGTSTPTSLSVSVFKSQRCRWPSCSSWPAWPVRRRRPLQSQVHAAPRLLRPQQRHRAFSLRTTQPPCSIPHTVLHMASSPQVSLNAPLQPLPRAGEPVQLSISYTEGGMLALPSGTLHVVALGSDLDEFLHTHPGEMPTGKPGGQGGWEGTSMRQHACYNKPSAVRPAARFIRVNAGCTGGQCMHGSSAAPDGRVGWVGCLQGCSMRAVCMLHVHVCMAQPQLSCSH